MLTLTKQLFPERQETCPDLTSMDNSGGMPRGRQTLIAKQIVSQMRPRQHGPWAPAQNMPPR